MTPQELDDLLAAQVITEREHDVLILRTRGLSQRQVSLALDLSRWAVRDREENAGRKIERHLRRKDAA